MKYAIVIPDGAADEPQEALAGRTPLEAAHTPAMDAIAAQGVVGRANHVPAHLSPGSAVANMSLLGYDPVANFTGRAPLEAAAQGIELANSDWAIRCNLVTIQDHRMTDFTAGHISNDEARRLLEAMHQYVDEQPKFRQALSFIPGVSYRNLLIWRGDALAAPFTAETQARPPHDLTDKSVLDDYPRGPGSDVLVELMDVSAEIFRDHPVNVVRSGYGRLPATHIWLWGIGRRPSLRPFAEEYGKRGVMITAVDLLRGLAALIGWDRIEVEGATGYTDTDYAAKGQAAIAALETHDIVCVHVEASDEASHEGDCAAKVKAIEEIDRHIVSPLADALSKQGDWRLLISPDHPTPLRTKTHSHGAVPLAMAGTNVAADDFTAYGDTHAAQSALAFDDGWQVMRWFLGTP